MSPTRANRRGAMLELAVLGLLHDSPLHGYEIRKRLSGILGAFHMVSFGSLYPCLKTLQQRGWVTASAADETGHAINSRSRITYALTPEGKEQLEAMLSDAGPGSWEDGSFDVHFAFFGQTGQDVRLRILEGRRSRLEERLDAAREASRQRRERADAYTTELHRHGLESTEREVRWLSELIETERAGRPATQQSTTEIK